MDISKLTPVPWTTAPFKTDRQSGDTYLDLNDAEFLGLARNAFDVMMRRGWHAARHSDGRWYVCDWLLPQACVVGPDPFTVLIEADKWYREHIEKQPLT